MLLTNLSVEGRVSHKCNKSAGEYAKSCVQVATETGTNCVNLYGEMMKQEVCTVYF